MDILAITIWREARGEGMAGMTGVYHVIMNRALADREGWPSDPEQVCLQPYQFSCWNSLDPQRKLYPNRGDVQYQQAQYIANLDPTDPTGGATAYFDSSITAPSWADPKLFTVAIGRLRFYKL